MNAVSQSSSSTLALAASRIGPVDSPVPAGTLRRPGEDSRPASQIEHVARGEDRVEISAAAQYLSRADQPFRADLVQRVKAEINADTYDTGEKFDIAVRRAIRDASRQA